MKVINDEVQDCGSCANAYLDENNFLHCKYGDKTVNDNDDCESFES